MFVSGRNVSLYCITLKTKKREIPADICKRMIFCNKSVSLIQLIQGIAGITPSSQTQTHLIFSNKLTRLFSLLTELSDTKHRFICQQES